MKVINIYLSVLYCLFADNLLFASDFPEFDCSEPAKKKPPYTVMKSRSKTSRSLNSITFFSKEDRGGVETEDDCYGDIFLRDLDTNKKLTQKKQSYMTKQLRLKTCYSLDSIDLSSEKHREMEEDAEEEKDAYYSNMLQDYPDKTFTREIFWQNNLNNSPIFLRLNFVGGNNGELAQSIYGSLNARMLPDLKTKLSVIYKTGKFEFSALVMMEKGIETINITIERKTKKAILDNQQ